MTRVRKIRFGIIGFAFGCFALLALSNHLMELRLLSSGMPYEEYLEWSANRPATVLEWFVGGLFAVGVGYFMWWTIAELWPGSWLGRKYDYLHDMWVERIEILQMDDE